MTSFSFEVSEQEVQAEVQQEACVHAAENLVGDLGQLWQLCTGQRLASPSKLPREALAVVGEARRRVGQLKGKIEGLVGDHTTRDLEVRHLQELLATTCAELKNREDECKEQKAHSTKMSAQLAEAESQSSALRIEKSVLTATAENAARECEVRRLTD